MELASFGKAAAIAVAISWALGPVVTVQADEGMWLLNNPPRQHLKDKYNFDLTDAWLERAMKASVRFNNGGSGGFLSPDGLIVTNHHVGADCLQKLSPKGKDYYRDGFYARNRAEEPRCPDLELNVLQSIEDITARVNAAVKPEMTPAQAFAARRAIMSEIEKESLQKTGLRSDVVALYQGGAYHLYRYKKYTDVRLVLAPEQGVASFGGDVDNFEFPRFNLDVCFFRAYENDKPAKVDQFFKWSAQGPSEGDLVFVTGHPGSTNRLETLAKLIHRRDVSHPYTLARLRALEAALLQFSAKGPEERTMAGTDLHRVANARKVFSGQYQGLLDPEIIKAKDAQEKRLQSLYKEPIIEACQSIAEAQKKLATFEKEFLLFERGDAFFSEYFAIARHLVRMPAELEKPSGQRLREYRDSNLESLRFQLFSPAPIHADVERAKLAASLTFLAEVLGSNHPLVKEVLAGKPPAVRAAELVAGTKLADPAQRKRLAEGSAKASEESNDSIIRLARLVDSEARKLRKRYEDEIEEVERQAYAKISAARTAKDGGASPAKGSVAPDATFTLRLAFGVVKGYGVDGENLPFHTTFAGAFERAEKQKHREPFELPSTWMKKKERLDLTTPFNFVSTADTIGGNSGSPVLNRAGELIGINFDRNRHGLVRNFVYTDEQARHIAVHSRAVLEALRNVYDAGPLLKELGQ